MPNLPISKHPTDGTHHKWAKQSESHSITKIAKCQVAHRAVGWAFGRLYLYLYTHSSLSQSRGPATANPCGGSSQASDKINKIEAGFSRLFRCARV